MTEGKERYAKARATATADRKERRKYQRTTHKVLTCTDRPGLLGPKAALGYTGLGCHRDKINGAPRHNGNGDTGGKGPGKGVGRAGDQMNAIL